MNDPQTWEEAAAQAAEEIGPWGDADWSASSSDIALLRDVFAGVSKSVTPGRYARSLAGSALYRLIRLDGSKLWKSFVLDLMARKQHDYGHGNINAFGVNGVIVRLSDKIERYKNLVARGGTSATDEPLVDTLVDIVGYCIILRMLEAGTFDLPLAADKRGDAIDKVLDELLAEPAPAPDVFLVSVDDVKRIVRDELKAYHDARFNAPYSSQGLAATTWARYAATAFGGQ